VGCKASCLDDCIWRTLQLTQEGSATEPSTSSREGAPAAAQQELEDVILHSTNQFYKWHSELEAAFASETEEKYKQYAADLQGRLDSCADILGKARCQPCYLCFTHIGISQVHACNVTY